MGKKFVSLLIIVGGVLPAAAETFPADGLMQANTTYIGAATERILPSVEDGATVDTMAIYDVCGAGYYCPQGEPIPCEVGSYSAAGASTCTQCQDGTTTSTTGATSCNAPCGNAANVATWDTGTCVIATCNTGYHLKDSACVANQITINWYRDKEGTDLMRSTQVSYDGNITTPTEVPVVDGKEFKGWTFKK